MLSPLRLAFLSACIFLASHLVQAQKASQKLSVLATFQQDYSTALLINKDSSRYPRSTKPDGTLSTVGSGDWTSGFFPATLWNLFAETKDPKWEYASRKWSKALVQEQYNKGTHDLGFMMYCPFGMGYRLTGDTAYKIILIKSAASLASRFNAKVGAIRSWDHQPKGMGWVYPVIIDNMMNLELLFWASSASGNPAFKQIAIAHANTTLANHFRDNSSSYHVVDYDTNGKVRWRGTHQGYANASAWARGQAWGLYGYTVCYRETKDQRYLDKAKQIANYMLNHRNMPKDLVPYWDYQAPEIPNEARDASAAAVAASGMLEMATYLSDLLEKEHFLAKAKAMIKSLSSPAYMAPVGTNNNFVLMHSTGSAPHNSEVDTPLNYADYYFLEALQRQERLAAGKPILF